MKGGGTVIDAQAARNILSVALIAPIMLGLAGSALWLLRHGWAALLPPPLRDRFVRWGFIEIILTLALVVLLPGGLFLLLRPAGFFRAVYGEDPSTSEPTGNLLLHRAALWVSDLAIPILIVLTLALMRLVSGTRLRHFGFRWRRVAAAVTAGFVAWLLVAPLVFGLHLAVVEFQKRALHWPPSEHPIQQLLQADLMPAEYLLLVLQAVILAPVWEEFLFRGLLLPRLAKHEWGGHAGWAAAGLLAALPLILKGFTWQTAAPLLFALAAWIGGAAVTAGETGPYWKWRAILGSATLFAMVHAEAWPAPIPLLPLAVALGWLAYRTRGLVAPIVLHALFNSVSTLLLLRGWVNAV